MVKSINSPKKKKIWIITRDADFQNYYKFITHDIDGVILVKLTMTRTDHLLKAIESFLNKHQDKLSKKHMIILEDDVIRIY
ncbi:MAG: DUF5615 family PIN-like protein [bacterium]